jgi:hypothetical protein
MGYPTSLPTVSHKLVTIQLIESKMKGLVHSSWDRNDQDSGIAIVAAKPELAASLLSLTLDFSEITRKDVHLGD